MLRHSEDQALRTLVYRLKLTFKAVMASLLDMVILVQQIQTVLLARGGIPHPRLWTKTEGTPRSWISWGVSFGDILLLALVGMLIFGQAEPLVPDPVWRLGEEVLHGLARYRTML